MATAPPAPAGNSPAPLTQEQILGEALIAVYDPILWLRDAFLWFIEAGDVTKANATLAVYSDLVQDGLDLAGEIANQANTDAAMAAATAPAPGM